MRFFVSVEPAIPVVDRLSLLQDECAHAIKSAHGAARWTPAPHIRLNLKVMQNLEAGAAQRVREMLEDFAKALAPFSFESKGTQWMHDPGMAKLLTTQVHDPSGTLEALQQHIDQAADHIGFQRDTHPWKPHILLGRLATPKTAVDFEPIFAPFEHTAWGRTECKELILFRSQLVGRSARTRVVRRFQLGSGK